MRKTFVKFLMFVTLCGVGTIVAYKMNCGWFVSNFILPPALIWGFGYFMSKFITE